MFSKERRRTRRRYDHAFVGEKVPKKDLPESRARGKVEEKVYRMIQVHEERGELLSQPKRLERLVRPVQIVHQLELIAQVLGEHEYDHDGQCEQQEAERQAEQHHREMLANQVVLF